jgi:hypothetical protein
MKRLRLATAAALAGLGLVTGCANMGNGPLLGRFRCPRGDCECGNGIVAEGPVLGEPGPPALPPGAIVPEAGVPPLAPPPRIEPQAQPTPAGPTSKRW